MKKNLRERFKGGALSPKQRTKVINPYSKNKQGLLIREEIEESVQKVFLVNEKSIRDAIEGLARGKE